MKKYVVRTNCEYSIFVEAKNPEEAKEKAAEIAYDEWDGHSWSEYEVDDAEEVDEAS